MAVIEAGGIGCTVQATPATLTGLRVGQEAFVHASLVVCENSMILFGFAGADGREIFDVPQAVSGVGPKLALIILTTLTPNRLRQAVASADIVVLTRVSGVGKEGTQRLVLEIGTKLGPRRGGDLEAPSSNARSGDVVAALIGLGFSEHDVESASSQVGEATPEAEVPELLHASLKTLGTRKQPVADSKDSDASSKGIISPAASEPERTTETALRPRQLSELVDQETVRSQLSLVLEATVARGEAPDHVLLSGPPGLGKTTLPTIIAAEVNDPLRLTPGLAVQSPRDLAVMLSFLQENNVLFIDEIRRLTRTAKEMPYLVTKDFEVDVMVGKGPGATSIPLPLPPFTVVGTATRVDLLPAPLHDHFGFTSHLEYYKEEELVPIVTHNAVRLQANLGADVTREIASRSRGTLGVANRLLRRVQDWVQVRGNGVLDLTAVRAAFGVLGVDRCRLDRLDRAILKAVCMRFRGELVGLTTLAVSVGEEPETVETVAKPYLVRKGFLL